MSVEGNVKRLTNYLLIVTDRHQHETLNIQVMIGKQLLEPELCLPAKKSK